MKSLIHEAVDLIDEVPAMAAMVGVLGVLWLVLASLLHGEVVSDSLVNTIFWGGFAIIALGLLGMLVSLVIPPYLNHVSDGTVDLNDRDIRFYGRKCELHTLVVMWAYGVFLAYLSAVFTVGILTSVPFYVFVALAGIVVTLVGIHYGLKMTFRVLNALKGHENDPNAHKRGGE